MKSKFKKLMAAALVLCLMLALLPAGVLADGPDPNGEGGEQPQIQPLSTAYVKVVNNVGRLPANGTIKINGTEVTAENFETGVSVTPGQEVTVTIEPNPGSGLYSIKGDSVVPASNGNGTYTFTMPADTETVTLTVVFQMYRNLTIESSANGTIKINGSTASPIQVMETDNVMVEVTANEGFEVGSVYYKDAEGNETLIESGNFAMPRKDITVCATFTEKQPEPEPDPEPPMPTTYTVTTSSSVGGSVTATPSTGLSSGDTVTVYVQPSDGYYLKSLTVGGEDVTNLVTWDWYWNWYYSRTGTYSFLMPAKNVNVVATFDTWYDGDIACIYDGRFGNVTLNVWSQALDRFVPYTSASKGDLVQVIVEPYNGYAMNSLSISERNYWGSSVDYWQSWKHDNVYYFYMPDSDVNLYVDFTEAAPEHIVYVDKAANGSLKADTTWAADGQIVYVTATPDTGYVLSSLFVKTAKGDQLKVYEAKKAGVYYFYMPDQYVTVSAYFAPAASALPFNDVAYTSWYYDAVKFVYDKGIMDGVSYYRFAPDATITRGMVVTMLWRMAGEPYEAAAGFTDVAAGRYYTTAVAWAAKNGIVEGMTATTFAPDQAITREQLASILYRYAKWLGFSGYGSDISGYTDAGKVSSYAYDAMSWAVRSGVVTGTSARVLDPQGTASRAAAAQMFMNFYNYIK